MVSERWEPLDVVDSNGKDVDVARQFVMLETLFYLPGSRCDDVLHAKGYSQAGGNDAKRDKNQQAAPFQRVFTFRSGCIGFS